jgi:hypothetical protein
MAIVALVAAIDSGVGMLKAIQQGQGQIQSRLFHEVLEINCLLSVLSGSLG